MFYHLRGENEMSRNAEQKIKLLILYDLLQKNTDENHPMTTGEITTALKNCGIVVTRKTLYDDIETLNRYGFEILCDKSRSNRYYVADRKFERPEVQILLQAIGGAKFLSDKKTSLLSRKVAELLGEAQAEELIATISENQSKSQNEQIYYNIDAITTALLERKKISFLYFDTDIYGKRLYRKNKERYEVNPLGLIYSGDYFYLVCYHDKYEGPTNYRIDRMESVCVEQENITYRLQFKNFDINAYRREVFSMYAGEKTEVELFFPKQLAEIARDRFGENCYVVTSKEGYLVRTTVRISKTFFAWLTTFEGDVVIKRPQEVKEAFADFIRKIENAL